MVSYVNIIVVNVYEYSLSEDKNDDIKDSFYEEIERFFDQLQVHHMKIHLDNFNAKVGLHNIFQTTIGNESVHTESNDNGIRLVNFANSKNPIVKNTTFSHRNIHKYTWTSPDGITHNQINRVEVDKGDSQV